MKIPYLLLPTLGTNKPSYSPASILKLIITALRQEARPIIKNLGLKHDPASRKIPIYSAGDTLLAISGIGKVSAGIATTHAYHLAKNSSSFQLYNIGVCGAAVDRFSLGQALTVNKIWDQSTDREFFPDMLVDHSLEEASLGTFDQPVTKKNRPSFSCDLVDMEASGVFQAGQMFAAPHQMLFLKVVTDYLDFSSEDYPQMVKCFEESLDSWLPILKRDEELPLPEPIMSSSQQSFLEDVIVRLRLTETQAHQLYDAANRFLVRRGGELEVLNPHLKVGPKHKAQRNQIFESIIKELDAC